MVSVPFKKVSVCVNCGRSKKNFTHTLGATARSGLDDHGEADLAGRLVAVLLGPDGHGNGRVQVGLLQRHAGLELVAGCTLGVALTKDRVSCQCLFAQRALDRMAIEIHSHVFDRVVIYHIPVMYDAWGLPGRPVRSTTPPANGGI